MSLVLRFDKESAEILKRSPKFLNWPSLPVTLVSFLTFDIVDQRCPRSTEKVQRKGGQDLIFSRIYGN